MIFEQTISIPEDRKLHLDIELPGTMPCGIACLRLIPNPPETMVLSETSLAKTWDSPVEDKAWENL
jgi:hypothetical protein